MRVWLSCLAALLVLLPDAALAKRPPSAVRRPLYTRRVATDERVVGLTVDEDFGPSFPALLDTLRAAGAGATFFVYGRSAAAHAAEVRQIVETGSEVGSRGDAPTDWRRLGLGATSRRLRSGERLLASVVGDDLINCFRPTDPYGAVLAEAVRRQGKIFTLWTRDLDGEGPAAAAAAAAKARPGDIFRLRDSGDGETLRAALAAFAKNGMRVTSVTELVLETAGHRLYCGVGGRRASAPGTDPFLAAILQKQGGTAERVARYLYGVRAGVTLEGRPVARLLPSEVRSFVGEFARRMNRPAVPVDLMPDGTVVDAVAGVSVDQPATISSLMKAKQGETVRARRRVIPPRWTRRDVDRLTATLGRFATWTYGSSGRLHNIDHAARMFNWLLLLPGESLSFLSIVGEGDDTAGWRLAPVLIPGGSAQGYGGGICQVSTTLYNAVKRGGLTILERHRHGQPVRYVPRGWDATVAYPHFDLRFRNDHASPVILRVEVHGARLAAWVMGAPSAGRNARADQASTRSMSAPRSAIFASMFL